MAFLGSRLDWSRELVERTLKPVLEAQADRTTQARLESYFGSGTSGGQAVKVILNI